MKRIFGYIFLIIGAIFGLTLILYMITQIERMIDLSKTAGVNFMVYAVVFFGTWLGTTSLLIFFGLRWIKPKTAYVDPDILDQ